MNKALVPLLGLLVLALPPALAQVDIHQEPAHFQPGRNSASLQDKIKGDQMVDYPWRAAAGQTMEVTPKASAGTGGLGPTTGGVVPTAGSSPAP